MHMPQHDIDTVLGWRGRTVRDAEGQKIGTFEDVLLDRRTDLPAWARVRTGLFGRRQSIVPLEGAEEVDDDVRVPYAKDHVTDGPNLEPDVAPTAEEEASLHSHYGSAGGTSA
jgi:PRC-barrel domain